MGANNRNYGKFTYQVDLVFVIDATGSMTDLIDLVKANALNFYPDLQKRMEEKHKTIDRLRIKVIAFRDYLEDGEQAMLRTDFFTLPEDTEIFRASVNSIVADGGGDDPEDGLEALAFAIRSKWSEKETGVKNRQIIVLWSDEDTHPLGFGRAYEHYPKKMAADFAELTKWWGSKDEGGFMDNHAKRLILYTPDKPGWNQVTNSWDNVIHFMSEAGKGLESADYEQIINAISGSI